MIGVFSSGMQRRDVRVPDTSTRINGISSPDASSWLMCTSLEHSLTPYSDFILSHLAIAIYLWAMRAYARPL